MRPTIQAPRGKAIVKFHPYRRDGLIIIPDKFKPQAVEAEVIAHGDNTIEPGTNVIVSLMDGKYWDEGDEQFCTIKSESIYLIYTEKDGKIDTVRPAGRCILTTNDEPIKSMGSFELPRNYYKPTNEGTVLAVGPGEWPIEEGDVVFFNQHEASKISIDGKEALFVPEKLIYGKREEMAA